MTKGGEAGAGGAGAAGAAGAAEARVVRIRPAKRIRGALRPPGDKSISHRALILGALAEKGDTLIHGLAPGADVQSTARVLRSLGVGVEPGPKPELTVVHPPAGLRAPREPLDCGNSGTTIRLLAGVLAAHPFEATLTGDASLRRRPMGRVAEPLRRMGAEIRATEVEGVGPERPPIVVRGGKLRAIAYEMKVASAQVKSAILLAGLRAEGETVVIEPTRSRDHTERMLRSFGVDMCDEGLRVAVTGPADLEGAFVGVPADTSSAAFFICAAAGLPGSRAILRDVGVNPTRTGFLDVLAAMGLAVKAVNEEDLGFEPVADLVVSGSPARLEGTRIAGEIVPRLIDEIPVLAVLATQAHGTTEIADAKELRVKESDRIETVAGNLARMGARVETLPDGLRIEGPTRLRGAEVDAEGDHRIAMAFAVAGLFAEGETRIRDADCARVSYPGFFADLEEMAER